MQQEFDSRHFVDAANHPAGGITIAEGLRIDWQNGPLGRGEERLEPNGAFVETVIAAAKDRLEFYQQTQFACHENFNAIGFLETALFWLNQRTKRRESEGVEGTHEGS